MEPNLFQWCALALAVALLIQGARGGYRRGPIRQLAGVLALLISVVIGALLGPPLGLWLFADSLVPWALRETAGALATSAVAWLVALAVLWRLGRRPKGAEEAENPVLGAIVGCWTGLLNAGLLVLALTAWAGAEETLLDAPTAARTTAVRGREALAELPGLGRLHGYSPWPGPWARLVQKSRRVLADPEASRHLMEQEPIRALASHPTFYTAWGDPEVKRLLRQGDFMGTAQHPKVRPLLNDENFQRQLLQLDLESAMDKALKKNKVG